MLRFLKSPAGDEPLWHSLLVRPLTTISCWRFARYDVRRVVEICRVSQRADICHGPHHLGSDIVSCMPRFTLPARTRTQVCSSRWTTESFSTCSSLRRLYRPRSTRLCRFSRSTSRRPTRPRRRRRDKTANQHQHHCRVDQSAPPSLPRVVGRTTVGLLDRLLVVLHPLSMAVDCRGGFQLQGSSSCSSDACDLVVGYNFMLMTTTHATLS